jgi:hypothetical protein
MENGLHEKLTRVEQTVSTIKNNLALNNNAPIEDVVTATEFNLKHMMNIFIQPEEPATKDGVWIKSEPFDFDEIKVDEDWVIAGNFYPENYLPESVEYINNITVVQDGDDIYFCNGYSSSPTSDRLFKWDAEKETIVEIPAFKNATSWYISDYATPACIVNKILYTLDRSKKILHTYSLEREVCDADIALPTDSGTGMSTDGTSIYFFSSINDKNYVYNIETATFKSIADSPAINSASSANTIPFYGGRFLIPYQDSSNRGKWGIYAYDPVEDAFYNYGTTIPRWWYNYNDLRTVSSVLYDSKIYHCSSNSGMTIVNLRTNTSEGISYSSRELFNLYNSHTCWVVKGQIYVSHGGPNKKVYKFLLFINFL